ncbi:prepilin-type N-terminal cleavage/methylation domain-containing protein [Salinibacterium sp. ZJ70]|uniref:prepilin-type N-terminal cleavage/methylation domain-containing protein n=1 Tax=Salinibacterium sp. ZJ70 TaxID=2708084 RepID=UPI001420E563|nr:prepilin-type N-terminal cleavage/methylation domain-containing protein [Salinibacterium sp. ZJ70]
MTRIQELFEARAAILRDKKKNDKGFTLVELLVVIIIIGILAAIAVPVFLGVREGAWKSSVESDVHNTMLAVEQYAITNNGSVADFPDTDIVQSADNTIEVTVAASSATNYTITGENKNLTGQIYSFDNGSGEGTWTQGAPAEDEGDGEG